MEDSVPADRKCETRHNLKEKLGIYKDREYIIRVNSINSEYFKDDIEELIHQGLFAFMVPKIEKSDDIYLIRDAIEKREKIKNNDNIFIIPIT